MKKSSSVKKGDENDHENIKVIKSIEEKVINNNKKKELYFSSLALSKHKKYKLNDTKNNNTDKKINLTTTSPNKILNIDTIEREKIDEENILSKINIYNSKANLNEMKKIHSQKNLFKSKLPSEEIFIRQKEQIKLMKEKNDKIKNNSFSPNINFIKKKNHKRNYTIPNLGNIIEELNSLNNNDNDNDVDNKILRSQKYSSLNKIKRKRSFRELNLFLTIDNPQLFEISDFQNELNADINEVENEEENDIEKIPAINNSWKIAKKFKKVNNCIEFSNIALRTLNEVNYNTDGVEINVDFSLVGNAEFWIFSRCFINKDFNESEIFDTFSINNESNVIFNKYTSLIKINKEKNTSKCFVSFGTFYEDETDKNKIKYETFLKRQLIDYSEIENSNSDTSNSMYYYLENDLMDIRIIIIDLGNEVIDAKIFINNNNKFNHIEGKFYLPTIKRSKLLFCGIGQSVLVRKLRINSIDKSEDLESDVLNKKSCTCCNIY